MKKLITLALLATALLISTTEVAYAQDPAFADKRNTVNSGRPGLTPSSTAPTGAGLAPTTWGFTSSYSGTLYGTGYYGFRTDSTYMGTNYLYGNNINYPGSFVAEIRAVYVFDISGLCDQPSPLWSAFMLDNREAPAAGSFALTAIAAVSLNEAGGTFTLDGQAGTTQPGTVNIDVYDAEDFENATPFATPEAAFSGDNTFIDSFVATFGGLGPFSVDVTSAIVGGDCPIINEPVVTVPTLGTIGFGIFALLLLAGGFFVMRRQNGQLA